MSSGQISINTQATLLLTSNLGMPRQKHCVPFTPREYHDLELWLFARNLEPADLLAPDGLSRLDATGYLHTDLKRIEALLQRGGLLALRVEKWMNMGIWVTSRQDEGYPKRLLTRLQHTAPPVIFGVGKQDLLDHGGLAIVGSRDVDTLGVDFTVRIARLCANQGIPVVSGGAKGVDSAAMLTSMQEEGITVGVISGHFARTAVSSVFRQSLRQGNTVLITPYDPDTPFSVANAMNRNKLVYTLSDWALVVSSAYKEGGTWAGAIENLKHRWVPLYVRSDANIQEGNNRLLRAGAYPITYNDIESPIQLRLWFSQHTEKQTPDRTEVSQAASYQESETMPPVAIGQDGIPSNHTSQLSSRAGYTDQFIKEQNTPEDTIDLYYLVLPVILQVAQTPRSEDEFVALLHIHKTQLKIWLQRAVDCKALIKTGKKPIRYRSAQW